MKETVVLISLGVSKINLLLQELTESSYKCVIIVTHSKDLAEKADAIIHIGSFL